MANKRIRTIIELIWNSDENLISSKQNGISGTTCARFGSLPLRVRAELKFYCDFPINVLHKFLQNCRVNRIKRRFRPDGFVYSGQIGINTSGCSTAIALRDLIAWRWEKIPMLDDEWVFFLDILSITTRRATIKF